MDCDFKRKLSSEWEEQLGLHHEELYKGRNRLYLFVQLPGTFPPKRKRKEKRFYSQLLLLLLLFLLLTIQEYKCSLVS